MRKSKKERNYHEVFLKPYPTEEGFGDHDAIKVSVLDDEMFVIEKIITHRKNESQQLEILIKWYSVDEPEWKTYEKKINNNIYILQYLEKNGFQELITTAQKRRLEVENIPNQERSKVRFKTSDEEEN